MTTLQVLKNVGSPKTKKKLNTLKTKYFFFFKEQTTLIMILRAIILQKIVFLADATCKVKLTWKTKTFLNDTQYQKIKKLPGETVMNLSGIRKL